MISNEAFVLSLGLFLSVLVIWAFRRLPDERWQFLASVPILKDATGTWHGLNFTYYGLLTANALVFGMGLLVILFGALHVPTTITLAFIVGVLIICLPAARWVAMLVEGKQCTFYDRRRIFCRYLRRALGSLLAQRIIATGRLPHRADCARVGGGHDCLCLR